MNSFFPDTISSWNNAISHFQNVPSLGTFKKHITSLIHPEKKSIFGIHDHSGVGFLFQLRVGLCSLIYHKKRHDFVDTPSNECSCNCGIEDTNNFLFLCPFCKAQRAILVTSVIGILQKYNLNHLRNQSNLYLYGHREINLTDNRKILVSTRNSTLLDLSFFPSFSKLKLVKDFLRSKMAKWPSYTQYRERSFEEYWL